MDVALSLPPLLCSQITSPPSPSLPPSFYDNGGPLRAHSPLSPLIIAAEDSPAGRVLAVLGLPEASPLLLAVSRTGGHGSAPCVRTAPGSIQPVMTSREEVILLRSSAPPPLNPCTASHCTSTRPPCAQLRMYDGDTSIQSSQSHIWEDNQSHFTQDFIYWTLPPPSWSHQLKASHKLQH